MTRIKYLLILTLLALLHVGNLAEAQISSSIHLTQIPDTGILLNQGWKFFAGDNPDFAKPEFDDRNWKTFDPVSDSLRSFTEGRPGIFWIRLRFSIDSGLLQQQFAVMIEQYLASELHINGKLVHRYGTVSSDPSKVKGYAPFNFPITLPPTDRREQVWAIRYAFQPGLKFFREGGAQYPIFKARIISSNNAFGVVKRVERLLPVTNTFRLGAFFIIAILHFVFFLYNRAQKAYLYFFIYAVFMMAGDLIQFNIPGNLEETLFSLRLVNSFWRASNLFLLAALYTLLGQKKGLIFWGLVVLGIITTFNNNWNVNIFLLDTLITLELVRTGLKTSRQKTKGYWIITTGAICFLFFQIMFNIGVATGAAYWHWPLGETYTVADLIYVLALFSIPVATTVYIALNFAFTSRALELKLSEVDALSRKTIEQEKEKQQILEQANINLEKQVAERTGELQRSLSELRATQSQLIQSEKMASLGELTAGIAHEIQNPLNFVNNFAEVNTELNAEGRDALKSGNLEDAEEILGALADNNDKILHHGKRADAIVKGMLQHSRTSTGVKEPTDINALVDEYLRLAYHGMRAKDKSFNADYSFSPDPKIGKVNVVPQDLGRVILNLINNAFHAVNEKAASAAPGYMPKVEVSTMKSGDRVLLTVRDNGKGIPAKIKDKIFQPFFTTKPTGEGTGLGLSLSYDIVKAHGGEIKVESKEGEGTEFTVSLPV